jgi:hypothetical protein
MAEEAHSLFSASGADAWSVPRQAGDGGRPQDHHLVRGRGHRRHTWPRTCWATASTAARTRRGPPGPKITVVQEATAGAAPSPWIRTWPSTLTTTWTAACCWSRGLGDMRLSRAAVSLPRASWAWPEGPGLRHLATSGGGSTSRARSPTTAVCIPAGDELVVDDLKYGEGRQGVRRHHAASALRPGRSGSWPAGADFTRVRLVIHQPRKDHWDEHGDHRRGRAAGRRGHAEARRCRTCSRPGTSPGWPARPGLHGPGGGRAAACRALSEGVSDKGCRFCDAKAVCPADDRRRHRGVSAAGPRPSDFEDLTPTRWTARPTSRVRRQLPDRRLREAGAD